MLPSAQVVGVQPVIVHESLVLQRKRQCAPVWQFIVHVVTESQLTSQLALLAQSRTALVADSSVMVQLLPPAHEALHVVALLHASWHEQFLPHDCEHVDVEPHESTQHGEHIEPQPCRQATPARSGGTVDIIVISATGGGAKSCTGGNDIDRSTTGCVIVSGARSGNGADGPVAKSGGARPASRSPLTENVQPASVDANTHAANEAKKRTNKPLL